MKAKSSFSVILGLFFVTGEVLSYPSAAVVNRSKSCLSCHVNNGPWKDDEKTLIDIIDKDTGKSFKQPDGTFLIQARQGKPKRF